MSYDRYKLLPDPGSLLHWSDGHSALSIWPSVWQQASLPFGVLQQLYDKTENLQHFDEKSYLLSLKS